MSWGISENASDFEKIRAESADYLNGLNSCGKIAYAEYSEAFDFYWDLLEEAYNLGKNSNAWVPCSERMPDPQEDGDQDYSDWMLVTVRIEKNENAVGRAYYCFSEKKWYMEWLGCGEVIAWKPLPLAYQEERDSEGDCL